MMAGLALAAATALLIAWLSWHRPMLAVCGLLALILSNLPDIIVNEHGLYPVGPLVVPAVATLLLLRRAAGRERLDVAAGYLLPAFLFFMAVALRLPWAADGAAAMRHAVELAKNLLIVLVLIGFLTTERRLLAAVRTAALTIGALAALSVLQYVTGRFDTNWFGFANASYQHISGELHGWRTSGPLPDPNFYAQLLVMGAPLAIVLTVIERNLILRTFAALAALAIPAAILLTYSRGALLGLLALALGFILTTRQRALLLPALPLAVLLLAISPADVGERLQSGLETGRLLLGSGDIGGDPAVIQRISVMRAALHMFAAHPLLGIGPGQFTGTYASYALLHDLDLWAPPAAHSLYLELAAEQGLLGLVLMAALIGGALAIARRTHRHLIARHRRRPAALVQAVTLALVGYFATALFLHDAYPRFFWTFLALLLAFRGAFYPPPTQGATHAGRPELQAKHPIPALALQTLWNHISAIITGAILFAAVVILPGQEESYRAEATLLYRFGREYTPVTPTEVRRNWGENIIISLDTALATEMHLLASHAVARKALEHTSATVRTDPHPAMTLPETRSSALLDRVQITRIQNATLLRVTVEESHPLLARDLLDAYLAAYFHHRDTLFHADASAYFEQQRAALKDEETRTTDALDALRAQYRQIEQANTLTEWSPDDPLGAPFPGDDPAETEARLARIDADIAFTEARLANLQSRRAELAREQDEWQISRAYTDTVAPNVEIADQPPVTPVGSYTEQAAKALAAAIAGAILVWSILLISALKRRGR